MASKKITRTCSSCGRTERCAEGSMPEGWSFQIGDRGVEYMCVTCARVNLRAIEAKLPQDYWEF